VSLSRHVRDTRGVFARHLFGDRDAARKGSGLGRLIRHAALGETLPVLALTVAMIAAAFVALLMAAICFSTLSADGFGAAPVAAVALPTVARATDEKDATAPRPATKPLTKNDFGGVRHPFRRRNWTTAAQLWQATHCCCRRALRSSRPGPDRHQRSGPFRFSAFKRPHYQTGN